jgi:predicted short-subunit dehydrogenase-like oxidoreductase (DUF2520 family)
MKIFVFGAGKLGRSFAKDLSRAGHDVSLRAARKGLPKKTIDADVIILALRDRDLQPTAEAMRDAKLVAKRSVVVHVSGAMDASPLAPLRDACRGVAQMHPMIAFASTTFGPTLARGNVHVQGDAAAVAKGRAIAKSLGMTARTIEGLDTIAYHAAAGLVANGAAALAAVGAELLVRAGVSREVAPKMLGPLLRSVAENVEALGFPEALTGPVRRGDASGLAKHVATLRAKLPDAVALYLASAEAQLPLARAIGDADAASFDAIADFLREART